MSPILLLSTLFTASAIYKLIAWACSYWRVGQTVPNLPGPPSASMFFGNTLKIFGSKDSVQLHRQWLKEYGPTIKYSLGLYSPGGRIYTTDLKAITHVLMNNYTYQKPDQISHAVKEVVGNGLLLAECDAHKRQRRILNPAFGPVQIRELTTVFVEKAVRLKDIWMLQAKRDGGQAKVDALPWLGKTALDIVGEAGFGYNIGALSEDPSHRNELSNAFASVFRVGAPPTLASVIALLRPRIPLLRFLPADQDSDKAKARSIMFGIGKKLLRERRQEGPSSEEKRDSTRMNDILSLLHRANTAEDVPDNQRLTDEEVIAQIPTFILAGHETTSTATTWALYALTKDKGIQIRLREELLTVPTDNPSMDELNALHYLDAVVRETLRLYSPLSNTSRVAMEDDVLPLEKPIADEQGMMHHQISITKGQSIAIPIAIVNTSEEIWGKDALKFNPARWTSVPQSAGGIPGVWSNILTFSGGPRACIGYRFSLIEMKALLFTLIRAFDFDIAVPHDDVIPKTGIVTRPILKTDPDNVNQLPLIVRPLEL